MKIHLRNINSRLWITRLIFFAIVLSYVRSASAQLKSEYPYICSNGQVYSVRLHSRASTGVDKHGVWQKFRAFCKSSAVSVADCAQDRTAGTLKCYREFAKLGNLKTVKRQAVVRPDKIRHSPPTSWLRRIAAADLKTIKKVCLPAIVKLGCANTPPTWAHARQLQCLYKKSSYANRSIGRHCFTALNTRLEPMAREAMRFSAAWTSNTRWQVARQK